jgi:hypothetical protein
MGSWVIHKQNGTTRATVKRLEYHGKLMDERYLTVDVESPEQIGFSAGDYVIYRSEKFSIRNIADVEKCARPQSYGGAFVYKDIKLVSQGWQELTDTEMTDYAFGDNRLHYTGLGSFSFYMSKVSDMAYRVQEVLNNKYTVNNIHTWTVLIGGNTLPLSPSNENLDALDDAKAISISAGTTVKETLDLLWQNWGITYKVYSTYSSSEEMWFHYVDMRPVSEGSIPLEYGKGNGLRKITRKLNPNVDICTRVRAYGSERNMPYRWYNNTYNDVNEAMYIPQLMLPHAMAYYDSDGHYCDENGNLYTSLPENGGAANPWATPNDVVLENVVKSAIYGKRDKEVHWNSDEMGEIFPSMKGMTVSEISGLSSLTYNNEGHLDQILDFEWASGDTGSSDPADLTSGKINFYVYVPNPGFNPISNNTSENVELLMQSGMCQSRGFIIITCEGLDSNRRATTDDGFSGTITQYKLTCAKITDGEIDQVFPNSTYDMVAGETFVFTGLEYNGDYSGDTWLSVYVEAAERRLLKAAAIWLRQHSTENFIYELELDNIYLKNHTDVETAIREGAMIQIPDNEFGTTVYEIIDSLTITEGKEAIPTYEITLLRRDESESLGDRVKGLVGQTISASSEIAKANDSLARKVNVANLMELLTPLAADGTTAIAWNQATLQNTHYLRANVDFFGVSGVSALGIGSGGGGGSALLNALLASLNGSTIGNVAPTISQNGKCPVWVQTTENDGHWEWGTTGGGGGTGTLPNDIAYWDDDDGTVIYVDENGNVVSLAEYAKKTWVLEQIAQIPSSSFNEAAMWTALDTNDSTKLIDDSHISATIRNGAAAGAAADGMFVHLTGDETIAGIKTFSGNYIVATKIKIGNAYISYNSNGLCIDDGNGGSMNLYATGGVSSLGVGSSGGGGGVSSLSELSDVNISSLVDGQGLVYDSATQKWVNGTVSGSAPLGNLLKSLNNSQSVGSTTPGQSQAGKVLQFNGSDWSFVTVSSSQVSGVVSVTTGTGLTGGPITSSGEISINETYQGYIQNGVTAYGWGNHAQAGYQSAISDLSTIRNNASNGATAYGWGNHANAGYASDSLVVHKADTETISGQKTFTASLIASNDIYLNKSGQQQWLNFNNDTKNFSFGQEAGGDCVLYSGGNVNFYTNINNNPYALYIQGSTGNVGIGKNNPTYKFDVNGNIHTNSGYYLDGRLFANNDTVNNSGLNIGYEYAVDDSENPSPLPTTLWGDGINFRCADGVYGGCITITDTHGNNTYGIMATDFIGVTNKFRFEYDLQNNTVWVLKADGTAVNFASFGGVTSLGVGSSGTPNISSMNIATLMTTNTTVGNQLNIGTSGTNNGQINFYDADEIGGASIAVNSGDLHITSDSTTYIESLLSVDGNITADGEVKGTSLHTSGGNLTMGGGNILMGGGRIYLDATRYLYLNGSSLMYYNGTSSINVA